MGPQCSPHHEISQRIGSGCRHCRRQREAAIRADRRVQPQQPQGGLRPRLRLAGRGRRPGKCYMLVKNLDFSTCYSSDVTGYGMDWFDAMECCYYNGGYLAEPVSQEEQALLEKYIVDADGGGGFALSAYWLGGNDMHHENGWIWPSGSPMTYTDWVEGEPSGEDLQDCMAIDSPKEHKWMDLDCSQAQHANVLHFAACEKIPGA